MPRCAAALCAVIIAVNVLSCGPGEPRAGTVQDEAMRAGVKPEQLVLPTPDYFHDMDDNVPRPDVVAAGDRGPQHVDGLDRRRRSAVGSPDDRQSRHVRSPEDDLFASADRRVQDGVRPPQSLALSRSRQRAVLQGSHRARSRIASDSGSTCATRLPARSVRRCETGIRASRSARAATTVPVGSYYGEPTGIVGLRLFPNPDFDEKARAAVELRALLQRSDLLLRSRPRPSVPRRHVVRLLSRRTQSDQAAGESGGPEVGEPELERRRAVLLVGPRLQLARRRRTRRASSTRRSTSRGPARSTRRSSPPTTSTIRAR